MGFCGVPTLSARAVDGDGFKFVGGIPGQELPRPGSALFTPLTATASGVRSARIKGFKNKCGLPVVMLQPLSLPTSSRLKPAVR